MDFSLSVKHQALLQLFLPENATLVGVYEQTSCADIIRRFREIDGYWLHADGKPIDNKAVVTQSWRCWNCRCLGKVVSYVAKWKRNAELDTICFFARNLPHACKSSQENDVIYLRESGIKLISTASDSIVPIALNEPLLQSNEPLNVQEVFSKTKKNKSIFKKLFSH